MSDFKVLKKESIAEDVFAQMLERITSGEWPQGSKIPSENELREAMGVSRDTVRQAIKRMCALGLMRSEQGRGTFVSTIDLSLYLNAIIPIAFLTEDDGSHIIQFMNVIQAASASMAAKNADTVGIALLRENMEAMLSAEDDRTFFERDMQFHRILAQLSGNPLFEKSMEITSTLMERYFSEMVTIHGRKSSIEQHRRCLEAVERGDENAAAGAMREHYEMLEERLLRALNEKKNA